MEMKSSLLRQRSNAKSPLSPPFHLPVLFLSLPSFFCFLFCLVLFLYPFSLNTANEEERKKQQRKINKKKKKEKNDWDFLVQKTYLFYFDNIDMEFKRGKVFQVKFGLLACRCLHSD